MLATSRDAPAPPPPLTQMQLTGPTAGTNRIDPTATQQQALTHTMDTTNSASPTRRRCPNAPAP
eukprot:4389674-Alexandrium_andersonii.AAC.1